MACGHSRLIHVPRHLSRATPELRSTQEIRNLLAPERRFSNYTSSTPKQLALSRLRDACAPAVEFIMPVSSHSNADNSTKVASLNDDGTLKWFIPPYVIPFVVLALVVARGFWLA